MKTDALRIGAQSGRIAVTGNSFSNSYIGEGKVKRGTEDLAAAGMVLTGASDLAISGNTFTSLAPQALAADKSTRRVAFTGNVLTDVSSEHKSMQDSIDSGNLGP